MASLVQAKCPGCKNVLRIPADWLHQPIRCKFCGLVMAAKQPSSSSVTPAPQPKKNKKYKTSRQTPVSIKAAGKLSPSSLSAARGGDPFADIDRPAPGGTVSVPRRRNPLGSLMQGLLIFLFLGGTAAGVAYLGWKPITAFLKRFEKTETVAQVDTPKPAEVAEPPNVDPSTPNAVVQKPDPPTPNPVKKPDPPTPDPVKKPDPPTPNPVKKPDPPTPDPVKKPDPPTPNPVKKPDPIVKKPDPLPAGTVFPRRALIISVNNYIFANPVQFGVPDGAGRKGENIGNLHIALSNGLNIAPSQIYLLSDRNKEDPHPPLKATIENTLTTFLFNSRAQDRIIVFFIGHAVEIDGKAYLAPLEGDLQTPDSLIQLDWVLKRMSTCKARQKILVLDGNRFAPTQGHERPSAGPMTDKFDALIKAPPAGVQIWSSCVMNQQSYETDRSPMGIFMDVLRFTLKPAFGDDQRPTDPIPVDKLNELVTAGMKEELTAAKLEQTPRVSGKEAEGGAGYDPNEERPPKPVAVLPVYEGGGKANQELIKIVFQEISTPSVKGRLTADDTTRYDLLPAFSKEVMDAYKADEKKDSELRTQVLKARAALWAVSPTNTANIPKELAEEAAKKRGELKFDLSSIAEFFAAPTNENQFKASIETREKKIAGIMRVLMESYEDLKAAGKTLREGETKRWQANYDFTLARLEAQLAYLFEYQSMLGQLRKDLPPRDPKIHTGWVLASSPSLTGDSQGKKLAASSKKLLDKIATDNVGTPWELIAKHEKFTALGLEWQPTSQKPQGQRRGPPGKKK